MMSLRIQRFMLASAGVAVLSSAGFGQSTDSTAQTDSSKIGPDGTAYVTRIVPVPATVSPEARKALSRVVSDASKAPESIADNRAAMEKRQAASAETAKKYYPATVTASTIAGVPVRVVVPPAIEPAKQNRVLINLHGGGFHVDSGSLTETIPIASLTGTKVISVLYRLAPEHPFPAAVEDVIAVYRELLKTYKPEHIAIYGTSAGAALTAQVTVRIKQMGLPMPSATGIFSGSGDMSKDGDSASLFGLNGLSGHLDPPQRSTAGNPDYAGSTNVNDPGLSPIYANLTGFPPTLFVTSGRDMLLSSTTLLHRAYLRAGVRAELIVFEALPHAFWNNAALPESREADEFMAKFFDEHFGK